MLFLLWRLKIRKECRPFNAQFIHSVMSKEPVMIIVCGCLNYTAIVIPDQRAVTSQATDLISRLPVPQYKVWLFCKGSWSLFYWSFWKDCLVISLLLQQLFNCTYFEYLYLYCTTWQLITGSISSPVSHGVNPTVVRNRCDHFFTK